MALDADHQAVQVGNLAHPLAQGRAHQQGVGRHAREGHDAHHRLAVELLQGQRGKAARREVAVVIEHGAEGLGPAARIADVQLQALGLVGTDMSRQRDRQKQQIARPGHGDDGARQRRRLCRTRQPQRRQCRRNKLAGLRQKQPSIGHGPPSWHSARDDHAKTDAWIQLNPNRRGVCKEALRTPSRREIVGNPRGPPGVMAHPCLREGRTECAPARSAPSFRYWVPKMRSPASPRPGRM